MQRRDKIVPNKKKSLSFIVMVKLMHHELGILIGFILVKNVCMERTFVNFKGKIL